MLILGGLMYNYSITFLGREYEIPINAKSEKEYKRIKEELDNVLDKIEQDIWGRLCLMSL